MYFSSCFPFPGYVFTLCFPGYLGGPVDLDLAGCLRGYLTE